MALWFAGASLVAVWVVFRDPALDHRLVVAGALLPDVLDAPFGGARVAHTLLASVVLLSAVMLLTRGRRRLRRQLLALPIGTFLHLVLDAAWAREEVFWWPALGTSFDGAALPSVDRGWANVPLELAGAAALVWAFVRFGLADRGRRQRFVRTGRIDRDLVR